MLQVYFKWFYYWAANCIVVKSATFPYFLNLRLSKTTLKQRLQMTSGTYCEHYIFYSSGMTCTFISHTSHTVIVSNLCFVHFSSWRLKQNRLLIAFIHWDSLRQCRRTKTRQFVFEYVCKYRFTTNLSLWIRKIASWVSFLWFWTIQFFINDEIIYQFFHFSLQIENLSLTTAQIFFCHYIPLGKT